MKTLRALFREWEGVRQIYHSMSGFFLWTGALAGLALLNITDSETWKTPSKMAVAIAFCLLTLPLIPFLVIGVGMMMLGDKIDAPNA